MFNRKTNQSDTDDNGIPMDNDDMNDSVDQGQEDQNTYTEQQQTRSVLPELTKPSVISEGFEFTGDVNFQGTLNVDGTLSGSINVQNLLIGSSGKVNGSIKATTIQVRDHSQAMQFAKI